MASEFYVAEDGSIHRHPVTVVNNTGNRTNTDAPASIDTHAQARAEYRAVLDCIHHCFYSDRCRCNSGLWA